MKKQKEKGFKKFKKEFNEEVFDDDLNPHRSESIEKINISLWKAYKLNQMTKNLVRATWGLAIATIVLIVISLFLK